MVDWDCVCGVGCGVGCDSGDDLDFEVPGNQAAQGVGGVLHDNDNTLGGRKMKPVTGNTYPVKEQIKALGGRWDGDNKVWMVPDDKYDEAVKLVATAKKEPFRHRKCIVCGHVEQRNSRGYVIGDKIYRSGECASCYEERKMGY